MRLSASSRSSARFLARLAVGSIALFGALGGAFAILLVKHRVDQQWHWPEFTEDLIRNFVVVGFVSVGTIVVTESQQRRADAEAKALNRRRIRRLNEAATLAASAWNVLPETSFTDAPSDRSTAAAVLAIQGSVRELRRLGELVDDLDSDMEETLYAGGMPQRFLEAYVAEGMRTRRFDGLQRLVVDLAPLEDVDSDWSEAISAFRRAARNAVGWRSHTDATIVERLLVETRISLAMGPEPRAPEDLADDLRRYAHIDPLIGTCDPLYVLIIFLTVSPSEAAREKADIVRRCMHSWRNEVLMIAEAQSALIKVIKLAELP